jgi:hypothetical protein
VILAVAVDEMTTVGAAVLAASEVAAQEEAEPAETFNGPNLGQIAAKKHKGSRFQ